MLHWQFQVRSAWEGVSYEPEKNTNSRSMFDGCDGRGCTHLAVVHEGGLVAEDVAGGALTNAPRS